MLRLYIIDSSYCDQNNNQGHWSEGQLCASTIAMEAIARPAIPEAAGSCSATARASHIARPPPALAPLVLPPPPAFPHFVDRLDFLYCPLSSSSSSVY